MNITIISGSPRQQSNTVRVAKFLKNELSAKTNHTIGLIDMRDHGLPHLQNTYLKEEHTPEEFRELRRQMLASDAFVLVSPEYNGSYTPALKNLVDFFAKDAFSRTAMAISTASPGGLGGVRAAMHMQQLVCALFGVLAPHMLIVPAVDKKIDADGMLVDKEFQRTVDNFITEFIWLAEKLRG